MDDTIINLCETWVGFINEKYGTCVRPDDVKEWSMLKAFPMLKREQVYNPLFDDEMWKRVKPIPGATYYIQKMIEDGHKVVIVTATHPKNVNIKVNYILLKYFPFISVDNVIITSQKQMILGDILIDDAPHNLCGGQYKKILINAPHNKSFDAKLNNIYRADGWKEIYQAVCNIANLDQYKERSDYYSG